MRDRNIHAPIESISEDILERRGIASQIVAELAGDNPPDVLGVFGAWGTGKSSLLKLIEIQNEAQNKLHIITIDAWKYDSSGNLFLPVIVELFKGVKKIYPDRKEYLTRAFALIADVSLRLFSNHFLGFDMGLVETKERTSALNTAQSIMEWENYIDQVAKAEEEFAKLVDLVLEGAGNKKHLVICIDNLDRCMPDKAITLLESIKNFFAVPNCTWVLAMDSNVIASYVDKKYQDTAMDGYSYLDKIIPEQYHIPPPSLEYDASKISRLLDTAIQNEARPISIPIIWKEFAQIPRVLAPRRMIKSAQKFHAIYSLPTNTSTSASPDMIFGLILLYHSWPEFYERFSSDSCSHIGGILHHFMPPEVEIDGSVRPIPVPEKFLHDQDLVHYMQQVFLTLNTRDFSGVVKNLASGMRWLREIGLP